MNKRYGSFLFVMALAVCGSLLAPNHAEAQDSDGRWMAFFGCWEPLDETVDRGLLCVRPEADGVELYTVVDGIVTTSDMLVASGQPRETSVEGCEGWEAAEFSSDGTRVFTSSEFVCGEETPRAATGVMSLLAPTRWLDVRSVDIDGQKMAWVQNYRLVGPERMAEEGIEDFTADIGMAVRTARMSASRAISIADVQEAAEIVDTKAVETWIAARGDRFDIDADQLVRMADAGLPESIIDVVVAVTFPGTFQVGGELDIRDDRPIAGGARAGDFTDGYGLSVRRGGYGAYGGYGSRGYGYRGRSFYWDPFYYGYSPMSSAYGYGYGGYGGGYGYPYGGYYYTPVTVTVEPRTPENRARVVNGRGYSRPGGSGSTGSAQRPRAGASSAPARGSGGSGASSGGSSGTTTRKAKPRGGR